MNRREFILGTGAGIGALTVPRMAFAETEEKEKQDKEEKPPTIEELAEEWEMPIEEVKKIQQEMQQPVMQTLKGYAKPICHSNYDREVFQKHLPKSERTPSLVMFYVDKPQSNDKEGIAASRGFASVFKQLSEQFSDQVKFMSYDQNCDFWSRTEVGGQRYGHIFLSYDIRAPPSTAMYSPFDLLEGETPQDNNGRITRIDTIRGGPLLENYKEWINFLPKWINTNIANPNKEYVWRFNNSLNEKKINI